MKMFSYMSHVEWKLWRYVQPKYPVCDSWVLFQEAILSFIHLANIYWASAMYQALS